MEINFKCEGMLAHSFDRFSIVTKFILPTINDLNFVPIDYDEKCNYLNTELSNNQYWKEYITKLKLFYEKIIQYIDLYKKKKSSYNSTSHKSLNEISLILPSFLKTRKKRELSSHL